MRVGTLNVGSMTGKGREVGRHVEEKKDGYVLCAGDEVERS